MPWLWLKHPLGSAELRLRTDMLCNGWIPKLPVSSTRLTYGFGAILARTKQEGERMGAATFNKSLVCFGLAQVPGDPKMYRHQSCECAGSQGGISDT